MKLNKLLLSLFFFYHSVAHGRLIGNFKSIYGGGSALNDSESEHSHQHDERSKPEDHQVDDTFEGLRISMNNVNKDTLSPMEVSFLQETLIDTYQYLDKVKGSQSDNNRILWTWERPDYRYDYFDPMFDIDHTCRFCGPVFDDDEYDINDLYPSFDTPTEKPTVAPTSSPTVAPTTTEPTTSPTGQPVNTPIIDLTKLQIKTTANDDHLQGEKAKKNPSRFFFRRKRGTSRKLEEYVQRDFEFAETFCDLLRKGKYEVFQNIDDCSIEIIG